MISISDFTLMRGTSVLIDHANAVVYPGQKVGVIGRNGCGKSSLFAAIMGDAQSESGSITVPKDMTISSVAQQTPALDISAEQYVIEGDHELMQLRERRDKAYLEGNGDKIALAEEALGLGGEWTIKSRAQELLHGLGFSEEEMQKPVKEFSGGWRMRLNLAQALICKSKLLLLDEPTNHLDLDTVIFLENWLRAYQGTVLCISHDRDFLDRFASHIMHFEAGKLIMYTGNYSAYEVLRADRIRNEKAARAKEEAALSHMQRFVERFRYKASKAKQAQSMLKAIDRLKLTAVTQEESPYSIAFQDPERTVDVLATLTNLDAGYSENDIIVKNINLMLLAGDRIGLLGRNGQGKSTFIKTLCQALSPVHGTVTLGKGVKIGYFAQHELESLKGESTALDHMRALDPKAKDKDLRSYLGSFSISGDKALAPVKTMSGGEQARLALCLVAYQKPNLLLLDEPTNHLDLDMREALSVALASYPGALILVSHDRYLLEAISEKFWLVDNGHIDEFSGDLDDYQKLLTQRNREYAEQKRASKGPSLSSKAQAEQVNSEQSGKKNRDQKKADAEFRQSLRPLKLEIEKLDKKMTVNRKKLEELDNTLADPSLYEKDKEKVESLLKERAELADFNDELEMQWLEKSEELEQRTKEYEASQA